MFVVRGACPTQVKLCLLVACLAWQPPVASSLATNLTYLVNLRSYLPTCHLPNIIDEDEKLFHSGQWVATSLSSRLPDFLLSASDVALAMEPTHF